VPAARADASVVVADMLAHGIDGFYYTGTPERAATIARALAERGFTGTTVPGRAHGHRAFVTAAGGAAEGWQVLTSVHQPGRHPRTHLRHRLPQAIRQRAGHLGGRGVRRARLLPTGSPPSPGPAADAPAAPSSPKPSPRPLSRG
jgi:ABC-type branched-subunit amino acid transport system substrate-binding protein